MPDSEGISDAERFIIQYGRSRSEAELLVEREVFGALVDSNGYTTPEQAADLLDHLDLDPGARLLELGSGRGWPGVYLAQRSGCEVTLTDVPVDAPRQCLANARRAGIAERSVATAASGSRLPFRPRVFDAVVHSDVFC